MTSAASTRSAYGRRQAGNANTRPPPSLLRSGRRILVGDFFTIDGDKISRLVIFFGPELA